MARSVRLPAWAAASALCVALGAGAAPPEAQLALCGSCHGADGNSLVADNPRLAGQDAGYLRRQLADFKSGKRKSPVMGAMVATLEPAAMKALAEHFAEQKIGLTPGIDKALAAKGKVIYEDGIVGTAVPACSGCHGNDGAGDDKYPRIAGQHMAYSHKQLQAFKSGERTNDVKGVMGAIAKRMNDAEMQAVAHYVASLKED